MNPVISDPIDSDIEENIQAESLDFSRIVVSNRTDALSGLGIQALRNIRSNLPPPITCE